MRIRRLDLVRFGRFTDAAIDLPSQTPDLHIVTGPNEAGKSTVRTALGDLLFGIPTRSSLNFVHKYARMRLGAALETDGTQLEFLRRKGRTKTVLLPNGDPAPQGERALAPFLNGVDRSFFERMFSLDQERLRKGGQEILEGGGDDAGRKLFSAGAGIQDLQKTLAELDTEANSLWGPRKSANKAYFVAHAKLQEADARKREHSVSATRWNALRRESSKTEKEYQKLSEEAQALESEIHKISRIRRIAKSVADLKRTEADLASLGPVKDIPQDAAKVLADAEAVQQNARLRIGEIRRSLEDNKEERGAVRWDAGVLSHAADVKQLSTERINVEKAQQDLPKLQQRLHNRERELVGMAANMGWAENGARAISARLPDRGQLEQARRLVGAWRDRSADAVAAHQALEEAEEGLARIRTRLGEYGEARDVETLRSTLAHVRKSRGTLGASIDSAHLESNAAETEVAGLFQELDPRPETVDELQSVATPAPERVQQYRDEWVRLETNRRSLRADLAAKQRELAKRDRARERILAEEKPVREADLMDARRERDRLWARIRKWILAQSRPTAVGSAPDLDPGAEVSRFQDAVRHADDLGDRRFETARAVARLAEADRAVDETTEEIRQVREELEDLSLEQSRLSKKWGAEWSQAPIKPGDPLQMLEWIGQYGSLKTAVLRSEKARSSLALLIEREQESSQAVLHELQRAGANAKRLEGRRLGEILEFAEGRLRQHDREAEAIRHLRRDLRTAQTAHRAKRKVLQDREAATRRARHDWLECAQRLGIDPSAKASEAQARLGDIGAMREVNNKATELRKDRIEKIQRDLRRFETRAAEVAEAVGASLSERGPRETSQQLERKLEEAREAKKRADETDRNIRILEQRISELQAEDRVAAAKIRQMRMVAGVDDVEGLRAEVRKADRHRELAAARKTAATEIREAGGGRPLAVLRGECDSVELDELRPRERLLRTELDEKQKAAQEAAIRKSEAAKAFKRVGGSDAAALAEAARQEALAEIAEVGERFVQVRAATCLLRWAIERYRTKKQGPMLERAGRLFSELTLGSFGHLEVDLNDKDEACLVGRRNSGERVPMEGMSDGSADQLYLALRIAALEDYLEAAQPMPFVADDLFVNFDDSRAAAGFRVLASLASRCQVIFFTHHAHLVEVARSAVPTPVHVVSMDG